MRGFANYILEARKKRPSGWTRTKATKRKVTNSYLAGDVYDTKSGTYEKEDTYSDSNYEGFIFDKEGNEYKVYGYSTQGDAGRIAGGSMDYRVVITRGDLKIVLTGYSAIFSRGSGTEIIPMISAGHYLEDYLAFNEYSIDGRRNNETIQALIAKGDKEAKSFDAQEGEERANKELEFVRRYVELGYINFSRAKKENEPFISMSIIKSEENKDQKDKIKELLLPFIKELIEGTFGIPYDDFYGFEFTVYIEAEDQVKKYNINPAIDIKKKNLVFIQTETKGSWSKGNERTVKKVLDTPVKMVMSSLLRCWPKNVTPEMYKLLEKVFDKYKKESKSNKTQWIKDKGEEFYDIYENPYWGKRKYTRAQAHQMAKDAWQALIDERDPANYKGYISVNAKDLGEFSREINTNFTVNADTPDTSVNDLPEIETTVKPIEAPVKKERGKDTVMGKGAQSAAVDKMTAWHEGTRRQNVGAMSDAKLKMNYNVCVDLGFDKEVEILKAEAEKRGLEL